MYICIQIFFIIVSLNNSKVDYKFIIAKDINIRSGTETAKYQK